MITRDLKVTIHRDSVLHQLDCYEDNELYEEVVNEYEEIFDEIFALCDPVFLMEYDTIGPELSKDDIPEGTPVLMVLSSIGKGVSEYSTSAFARGDYLKGMLADAMADSALFSLEEQYTPFLKEACANLKLGIRRRLEAPQDISMLSQKIVLEKTHAQELCGMNISTGYMLNPVKSSAVIYMLTENEEVFFHQHNCRTCNRYNCKMRRATDIPVKVQQNDQYFTLLVPERTTILDVLMKVNPSFCSVCGGIGQCGKCKIRVTDGYLPVTSYDSQFFSETELKEGMRLACKAIPNEPLHIELNFQSDSDFSIVSDISKRLYEDDYSWKNTTKIPSSNLSASYGIAIDIGTTTIAAQLLDLNTKERLDTYSAINHQRSFGADVISRIKASNEGKSLELKQAIQKDLIFAVNTILHQAQIPCMNVKELAISCNTTMRHLLLGYNCKTLGEYPFTPIDIKLFESTYSEIFDDNTLDARVRLIPGISTFVGGDITSGLYTCKFDQKTEYSLLIDLGTNGEIALGNQERILATSTAAGPAFEGGNIKWGVGSIDGAISNVKIQDNKVTLQTIGNQPPIGICGTGVIETVAELINANLVDETGCLDEDFFETGFVLANTPNGIPIIFTQQDIREIQLAKAAIRAGLETLILRYGIQKSEISHVYLAGGFGFYLDAQKAIEIGMIPEEFSGKIEAVGNSSLSGAIHCLLSEDGWKRTTLIGTQTEEINLSADKDFNRLYMEHMYFEKS